MLSFLFFSEKWWTSFAKFYMWRPLPWSHWTSQGNSTVPGGQLRPLWTSGGSVRLQEISCAKWLSISHTHRRFYLYQTPFSRHLFGAFLQINSANSNAPPSLDTLGIREPCETLCDERGCHCLADGNEAFEDIDHLIVRAKNGGRVACFCGSFSVCQPQLTFICLG